MRYQLTNLAIFGKRLGIALLMLTLCRLLFWWFNHSYFSDVGFSVFLGGLRFDLAAIGYLFGPFVLLSLAPVPNQHGRGMQLAIKLLFHLSNTLAIAANLLDLEYFKFIFRRTTATLFSTQGMGTDVWNLVPQFAVDYWYLPLLLILFVAASELLYRQTAPKNVEQPPYSLGQFAIGLPIMLLFAGLGVLASRGGMQLKPMGLLTAGKYTESTNVPLVLNTPYSIIRTLGKAELQEKDWFTADELQKVFDPEWPRTADTLSNANNIMLIILESISNEHIGFYNDGKGYTPFLDSLCEHSVVFTDCFANGRESIDAPPALFAGIPKLMEQPYTTSTYAGNEILGLPKILKSNGYTSAFYHGGTNGTMGFDAFCKTVGFDYYKGRSEYDNEADYDGSWGIWDEPYLQYVVDEVSLLPEPFFATAFTLSSHHPYAVPAKYAEEFPEGTHKLHRAIGYTDHALRRFFNAAKQQPWYDNTTFIITADHTAAPSDPHYRTTAGSYKVPLIFYTPHASAGMIETGITQHTDLYNQLALSNGQQVVAFSAVRSLSSNAPWAIQYFNGVYQYVTSQVVCHFDGENVVALYDRENDPLQQSNLVETKPKVVAGCDRQIKAIIQQYNHRMINNQLVVRD